MDTTGEYGSGVCGTAQWRALVRIASLRSVRSLTAKGTVAVGVYGSTGEVVRRSPTPPPPATGPSEGECVRSYMRSYHLLCAVVELRADRTRRRNTVRTSVRI